MATDDEAPKPEPPRASVPASTEIPERPPARERPETRELREPPRSLRETHDPRDPRDDKLTETIRTRLEALVPELVKKTFSAGLGAVFSTEEGIRKIAREVSLPDVAGYIATSGAGAKDKVFEIIARETRDFLANLNITDELAKLLTTLSLEVKTEIRFIPNSERFAGAEPDVKASVKLKRDGKEVKVDDDARDSRSRLRFWRRDGEGGDDPSDGGNTGAE
jgi:hypothetical protein